MAFSSHRDRVKMSRVEAEAKHPKHDVKVPRLRCRILALSAFVSIHEIFLKEYPMAQVYLSDFISSNESLPFNFENLNDFHISRFFLIRQIHRLVRMKMVLKRTGFNLLLILRLLTIRSTKTDKF